MKQIIELEIITARRTVLKTAIREIYIPAHFGKAGILENHLPYTTLLKRGEVAYLDTSGEKHYLFLREGLLEVVENRVVILSKQVMAAEELDGKALKKEMTEIRGIIKKSVKGEVGPDELARALDRQTELSVLIGIVEKLGS